MGADWEPLVQRVAAGDQVAEDALVAVFEDRLRCILVTRLGCVETARELTQDVIVRALRGLRAGEVREPAALPAYLHEIVLGVIAEHGRADESMSFPRATSLSAAEERVVRDTLAQLPALDREILSMAIVDGCVLSAIAARLGISPEKARERKRSALRRVRDALRRRARP
jgi:RNA polymerase sigma factor (sigma-70 family)